MNKVLHISPLPKSDSAPAHANSVLVSVLFDETEYHIPVYEDGLSIQYRDPPSIEGNPQSEASLFCLIANAIV